MSEQLRAHVRKFIKLNEEDAKGITPFFDVIQVAKKQNIIEEGKSCNYNYFVLKGCLHMFFTDEKGAEHTIQFAIENWWMTDLEAFSWRNKASFTVQAIETSELLSIDRNSMDRLLAEYPVMEKYFRMIYERAYAASLFRVKQIFKLSKVEFFDMFSQKYPDFIQRVPQKILASFLGFTPEYLSELRKKRLNSRS